MPFGSVDALTPGPGRVRGDLPVNLPPPRDQIETKELPEFVRLRTEVSRLVRSREERHAASGTSTTNADTESSAL
ncbi:MAG TPA: hypothetical protein VH021_18880 [Trebonia sp.]|jgi:NitT/TauT family transport system ATP-binding protein|nr:hypothetical protein [Trebonia sp.]